MAETYLDDLKTVGFKHFNPMWSFPTTSVNQNWEPMTFGMAPWHLVEETERSKEALVSQSPITAFKAWNSFKRWVLSIARLCCPAATPRENPKEGPTVPRHGTSPITWKYASEYADQLRRVGASALLCQECTLSVIAQLEQEECQSSKLRICRFSQLQYSHEWSDESV